MATPLGNLEDLTLRAIRTLREADLVACEDTRRTATLLRAHGIETPTTSFFEHNERWKGERILDALRAGRSVALVSDAGTPGISDPGYRLVRDARAAELPVVPVPGPSAAIAALSVSGLPSDRFLFVGFLPPRAGARRQGPRGAGGRASDARRLRVAAARRRDARETWSRCSATARPSCAERPRSCTRSTCARGSPSCTTRLASRETVKGEIVLVVAGRPEAAPLAGADPIALYRTLAAEGRTRRDAVKEAARQLGLPAREVYRLVQESEDQEE